MLCCLRKLVGQKPRDPIFQVSQEHVLQSQRPMEERRGGAARGDVVILLQHQHHADSTLQIVERETRVRFVAGASVYGRRAVVYVNVPSGDEPFCRSQYRALRWERHEPTEPVGDDYCEVTPRRAGTYRYYFMYDDADTPQGSGYIQVPPELRPGGGPVLPLEGVVCQTVITPCLGPLSRWRGALEPAARTAYNMVHLTPVQALGASGSAYSLRDHLRLDPRYGGTLADLDALLADMRRRSNMMFIGDIVLNHVANETEWLDAHPEATYNCVQCPYLRPAALLDAALARLSRDVAAGRLADLGVPARISTEDHVCALETHLRDRVFPALRLAETAQCDVAADVARYVRVARDRLPGAAPATDVQLTLQPDPLYRRRAATVDLELALRLYHVRRDDCTEEESLQRGADLLRARLDTLNRDAADAVAGHLRVAAVNCAANVRYFRVQADGPRLQEVSDADPLVPRYFTWPEKALESDDAVEAAVCGAEGARVRAHNGWIMNGDPLHNFALAPALVYLRRELIAWSDSVKLRYGDRPEDSPHVWRYMRDYVETTAEMFDGVRLDNCHSTPMCVAEHMLDAARRVNPDLYVLAELFTGSPDTDHVFVNRLGITALVREAQAAWDARELGRTLHRYGGRPVGSFLPRPGRVLRPSLAPALLMDVTHDNPSPLRRRTAADCLATAALVAATCCGAGSTRGYDELYERQAEVVGETGRYRTWDELAPDAGILHAKQLLNQLHAQLATDHYTEIYVDQIDDDTISVTRHNPHTRHSVIVIAVTAFTHNVSPRTVRPLQVQGDLVEILLEATLDADDSPGRTVVPGPGLLTGVGGYRCDVTVRPALDRARLVDAARVLADHTEIPLRPLPPGAVVVLRVAPPAPAVAALRDIDAAAPLAPLLKSLSLVDLSVLLYQCGPEEREAGGGEYDVPGLGPLPYCGLDGLYGALAKARSDDDLGAAICSHVRAGDWAAEYTWSRLQSRGPGLAGVAAALRERLSPLSRLPRYLVPAYLERAVHAAVIEAQTAAQDRLRPEVRGRPLSRALALCSVQLMSSVVSAPLPLFPGAAVMSAGLPHFSVGYMRCWGRDTFISLRGLLMLPGRWREAREHLIAFGACLRHGLIPNLLAGGEPRYNCRDAVWWWARALQQYVEEAPDGAGLLPTPVPRLFANDDAERAVSPEPVALHTLLQEAVERHFQGIQFRERNAGSAIDAHMTDPGFNVRAAVDPETGFVVGGNVHNCGTWMDKMGSSDRAHNRGQPATPRDGAAIEIVALSYECVSWLGRMYAAKQYPHPGVQRTHKDGTRTAWTWTQWADRIKRHFERAFYITSSDPRPDLAHSPGLYKDTVGGERTWADYQIRCNQAIAMAIAPDLFTPKRAISALDELKRRLVGPLGMKTLDPADWAYRPDYDNADDSTDPSTAHGFNYHQGPEWLWPLGFYLLARLAFRAHEPAPGRVVAAVRAALGPLAEHVAQSPWHGLPELTRTGGGTCQFACPTQAWSAALIQEVLCALPTDECRL